MKKKLIHIGMGKTGTTSLQELVFPKLCDLLDKPFYRTSHLQSHITRMRAGLEVRQLDLPDEYIVSSEALVGWDPSEWEEFADKNLSVFGEDASILITVRNPKDFLTSVYLQFCLQEGDVQLPQHFFLPKGVYSRLYRCSKFDVNSFSYDKLIRLYRERFQEVNVVKYENLGELSFLANYVHSDELENLQEMFKGIRSNRSFSSRAVRYTFKMQKLLNMLGLSFLSGNNLVALAQIDLMLRQNFSQKSDLKYSPEKRSFLKKVITRLAKELHWRQFVQKRLDKLLPYEKYQIDFDSMPYIDIVALEEEYNSI